MWLLNAVLSIITNYNVFILVCLAEKGNSSHIYIAHSLCLCHFLHRAETGRRIGRIGGGGGPSPPPMGGGG